MSFSSRTEMLIGKEGTQLLASKKVAVFGVGGVGGAVCEALARAGIGSLTLFDDDVVALSNLNRQVVALTSTLGEKKVEVMARRILDINPGCTVTVHPVFYTPENAESFPFTGYDYIVDAVDTVSAKLSIIQRAKQAGIPVISAMGAGNKLHPEMFQVADIEKTSVCPLARVMRRELKKRGIRKVKVVYSQELPLHPLSQAKPSSPEDQPLQPQRGGNPKNNAPGSISFVPAAAGLVLASAVVQDLLGL